VYCWVGVDWVVVVCMCIDVEGFQVEVGELFVKLFVGCNGCGGGVEDWYFDVVVVEVV